MFGGDLLRLVAVEEIEIGLSFGGGILLPDRALDDGHRIVGDDAHRRMDGIDLARTELAVDRHDLRFEGHQHVTDIALQEDAGRVTATARQHWHVLVKLADKFGRLGVASALAANIAPGGEISHAAVAPGLRIDDDDLHTRPDEVIPVLDAFRVAVAHQEQHGRAGRRRIVGEFLAPVLGDHALVGEEVDV
ncbi:MAG TPA: hypothetical protein PKC22_00940, partial [Rhodocyclaceae bacterium]|nr:hypothetical protein [Rhodocyclaceae bacterium]